MRKTNRIRVSFRFGSFEGGLGNFEFTDLKSGKRGRPTRIYLLNERQSTLLLTYLDNTEPVKRFKKDLVRAFFKMQDFIQSLQTAKLEFPEFTNAIMDAHEDLKYQFIVHLFLLSFLYFL